MQHLSIIMNTKHFLNSSRYGKINVLYLFQYQLGIYNISISIRNKLNEVELIIGSNNNKNIHIIALTEIRITAEENKYYQTQGYRSYFNNRDSGDGGVALFIHGSIQGHEVINECSQNINFLNVYLSELKFHIGVIYKQPRVTKTIFNNYLFFK